MSFTLPRDCTTDQARQAIGAEIGRLRRLLGEQREKIEDRDRIIEGLKGDRAALEDRVEELNARLDDLREHTKFANTDHLLAELSRWRGVVEAMGQALSALTAEYSQPARPKIIDIAQDIADRILSKPIEVNAPPIVQHLEDGDTPDNGNGKAHRTEKPRCSVPWCQRPSYREHEYCSTHWERLEKYGDPLLKQHCRGFGGAERWMEREVGPGVFEKVEEE